MENQILTPVWCNISDRGEIWNWSLNCYFQRKSICMTVEFGYASHMQYPKCSTADQPLHFCEVYSTHTKHLMHHQYLLSPKKLSQNPPFFFSAQMFHNKIHVSMWKLQNVPNNVMCWDVNSSSAFVRVDIDFIAPHEPYHCIHVLFEVFMPFSEFLKCWPANYCLSHMSPIFLSYLSFTG